MLILALATTLNPLSVEFGNRSGLQVQLGDIPLIRGSWFQYYEPGWTKGYYSSNWNDQDVERTETGYKMRFESDDKLASGEQVVVITGREIEIHCAFTWKGKSVVGLELCPAMLYAPAITKGKFSGAQGMQAFPLPNSYGKDPKTRELFQSNNLNFQANWGDLGISSSSSPIVMLDGRALDQDWSRDEPRLWIGSSDIRINPGETWKSTFRIRFVDRRSETAVQEQREVKPLSATVRLTGKSDRYVLKAKQESVVAGTCRLKWPISIQGNSVAPPLQSDILDFANSQFEIVGKSNGIAIQCNLEPRIPHDEGFELKVTPASIRVAAKTIEGFRHGLRRIVELTRISNGHLVLPCGTWKDWPATNWRGVHLFVGPQAPQFHAKLRRAIFEPFGYNYAVLQCERTRWKSIPEIGNAMFMKPESLKALFRDYRLSGIEPIPLIQSYGHMEWLLTHPKYRPLAFNPQIPYAIHPQNEEGKALLRNLWREAVELLQPKAIHFGLDETNMRGGPETASEVTRLWKIQLGFLSELSASFGKTMMLWGDKCLAPGEAIDAAHGDNKSEAKERRSVIPKGAMVTDWHYRADPNPDRFESSLKIWKESGQFPVASTWYRPENIRGFVLAAQRHGAGTLITTWAGYESNEENMLREFKQFSAMILAGDYAWSGRQEGISDFGYDPALELSQRLYGLKAISQPKSGWFLGKPLGGKEVLFSRCAPISLRSVFSTDGVNRPNRVELKIAKSVKVNHLALVVNCEELSPEGSSVAKVIVTLQSGRKVEQTIRYGYDVRAKEDKKVAYRALHFAGLNAVQVRWDRPEIVTSIEFEALNSYSGATITGISAW